MPFPTGTETLGDIPVSAQFFDKGGAVYNVMHEDFGAKGDGITDDTVALQAAIDAAVDGTLGLDGVTVLAQGTVYFPPGEYKHSGLTYSGAPWIGAGHQATRLAYTGSGASISAIGTTGNRLILNISDMQIDGTNASAGAYGIDIAHCYRSLGALRRVYISDFPSWGIYFSDDNWIQSFYDVFITRCAKTAGAGIGVKASVGTLAAIEWYNLVLEINGQAASSTGGGIHLGTTGQVFQWGFFGGTWEDNKGAAEAIFFDCESVGLYGVYVESSLAAAGAVDGLIFSGSTNGVLSGGRIHAVASHAGIALRAIGTSNIVVDNCNFHQANWPTHISVEDTAKVSLLSEGNLGTAHIITVVDGAAFSRIRPNTVTLTYSTTPAVDASLANTRAITLTGNTTIQNPTNASDGQRLTFIFTQDGVGGHTVAWDTKFKHSWSDTGNVASERSTITFVYFANRWQQLGAQSPYFTS